MEENVRSCFFYSSLPASLHQFMFRASKQTVQPDSGTVEEKEQGGEKESDCHGNSCSFPLWPLPDGGSRGRRGRGERKACRRRRRLRDEQPENVQVDTASCAPSLPSSCTSRLIVTVLLDVCYSSLSPLSQAPASRSVPSIDLPPFT